MFSTRRIMGVTLAAVFLSGCATVSFKAPDSTSNKGKKVDASLSHFNVFYLFPAGNLDKLVDDLSEQCGDGKVEGISLTVTRRFFYVFGEMASFEAAGRCSE